MPQFQPAWTQLADRYLTPAGCGAYRLVWAGQLRVTRSQTATGIRGLRYTAAAQGKRGLEARAGVEPTYSDLQSGPKTWVNHVVSVILFAILSPTLARLHTDSTFNSESNFLRNALCALAFKHRLLVDGVRGLA